MAANSYVSLAEASSYTHWSQYPTRQTDQAIRWGRRWSIAVGMDVKLTARMRKIYGNMGRGVVKSHVEYPSPRYLVKFEKRSRGHRGGKTELVLTGAQLKVLSTDNNQAMVVEMALGGSA